MNRPSSSPRPPLSPRAWNILFGAALVVWAVVYVYAATAIHVA